MVGAVFVLGGEPGEGQVIEAQLRTRVPQCERVFVRRVDDGLDVLRSREDWVALIVHADGGGGGGGGLAWLEEVRREFPLVPALVLLRAANAEVLNRTTLLSAFPCLVPCDGEVLERFLCGALDARRVPVFDADKLAAQAAEGTSLRPAHVRVLRELLAGLSPRRVAAKLEISPNTYRRYVNELLREFGYQNTADLVHDVLRQSVPPKEPRLSRPPRFRNDS